MINFDKSFCSLGKFNNKKCRECDRLLKPKEEKMAIKNGFNLWYADFSNDCPVIYNKVEKKIIKERNTNVK